MGMTAKAKARMPHLIPAVCVDMACVYVYAHAYVCMYVCMYVYDSIIGMTVKQKLTCSIWFQQLTTEIIVARNYGLYTHMHTHTNI